jgi:hypothetical protein
LVAILTAIVPCATNPSGWGCRQHLWPGDRASREQQRAYCALGGLSVQAGRCARGLAPPTLVLDGGDIFRLSRAFDRDITQNVYAHLLPEACEQDYHRVSFTVPNSSTVYALTNRRPALAG